MYDSVSFNGRRRRNTCRNPTPQSALSPSFPPSISSPKQLTGPFLISGSIIIYAKLNVRIIHRYREQTSRPHRFLRSWHPHPASHNHNPHLDRSATIDAFCTSFDIGISIQPATITIPTSTGVPSSMRAATTCYFTARNASSPPAPRVILSAEREVLEREGGGTRHRVTSANPSGRGGARAWLVGSTNCVDL